MRDTEDRTTGSENQEISKRGLRAIELFAGGGGLALGVGRAGFSHEVVVERDRHACETLRHNQQLGHCLLSDWHIEAGDVEDFDFSPFEDRLDLVAGGPPCQPFSIGGKHRGSKDSRNMFPAMIRAIRNVRPKVVLVENVRGLLRKSFATYFGYIKLQIEHPEVTAQPEEDWIGHLARLEQHHTSGCGDDGLSYNVVFKLANGANYGVPQKRERVFIVGFRSDLNIQWSFPPETHSFDALLHDQWISGEYWERHRVPKSRIPDPPTAHTARIDRLRNRLFEILEQPWVTVRDATSDLPDPENGLLHGIPNHRLVSGARSYKGHTGSTLDHPAKTLKAGDHGVPGGENMLRKPSGEVRYFTARESARLQTFPDHYVFPGSWSETMRQLGNAVPVELGRVMADSIAKQL